jgi:hypothetical protein
MNWMAIQAVTVRLIRFAVAAIPNMSIRTGWTASTLGGTGSKGARRIAACSSSCGSVLEHNPINTWLQTGRAVVLARN